MRLESLKMAWSVGIRSRFSMRIFWVSGGNAAAVARKALTNGMSEPDEPWEIRTPGLFDGYRSPNPFSPLAPMS